MARKVGVQELRSYCLLEEEQERDHDVEGKERRRAEKKERVVPAIPWGECQGCGGTRLKSKSVGRG